MNDYVIRFLDADSRQEFLANGRVWLHAITMADRCVIGQLSIDLNLDVDDQGVGWINDLYVRPDRRRCGVAGQLLDVAISFGDKLGEHGLAAGILSANHISARLFESRGFSFVRVYDEERGSRLFKRLWMPTPNVATPTHQEIQS